MVNTTDNEKYTIQDMYKQKYIFNSSGQLIKVIDDNGGIISIEYSSNKISKIIDGYNVNYSYTTYAPYRVATITEKAKNESGKSIKILYGGNWNWFDNSDGRSEEYSFNKAGNTTAIVTADGYAEAYRYVTEGEHKNSISKVSKLQYPIVQLLKNPGIESLTAWAEKIDGEAATSLNSDKSNAYIGNKSLKIISSSGKGFFSQRASISKGKEYTFSAYVKPDGELIKSKGSLIQLRYKDVSSKDTYVSSR